VSEAQKSDIPLSLNQHFHENVLKSIEFLTFCIDFYKEFVRLLGRTAASSLPRPSIKTARTPTAEDCLGNKKHTGKHLYTRKKITTPAISPCMVTIQHFSRYLSP
jgi:hypothetical protein